MIDARNRRRALIINTGGTIAMVHEDDNPVNPLVPGDWRQITRDHHVLERLPFDTELLVFDPLLDSSDIDLETWTRLAEIVRDNYGSFDGFVILHGTDTMCYTASALSFMLENLAKPVILTGSQLPLAKPRSDALENLVTSLSFAAGVDVNSGATLPTIPEVCIFFRGVLLRGNRARKLSSSAYKGFQSPNYPPLATVGGHVEVDTGLVREKPDGDFRIHTNLETDVMMIDIFPSMHPDRIKRACVDAATGRAVVKALVLRTFGAGNAPRRPDFLRAIHDIVDAGVIVLNVTQCTHGTVKSGLYDASVGLLEAGVINGVDMTPEAALAKVMWLLGRELSIEEVKTRLQLDQRGEQSLNIYRMHFGPGEADPAYAGQFQVPDGVEMAQLETAILRLREVRSAEGTRTRRIALRAYLQPEPWPQPPELDPVPGWAGRHDKELPAHANTTSVALDVTRQARTRFQTGKPATIALVADEGTSLKWRDLTLNLHISV